jgi:uncharacterized delta-60 repeat protein
MRTSIISMAFATLGLTTSGARVALAGEASGELCSDAALGVATDFAGRTLVVGAAYDNRVIEWDGGHAHYGDLAIARLARDGGLDGSFGTGGTLLVDQDDFDSLSEVVVHEHGLYAAGTSATTVDDRSSDADLVVVATSETGERQPDFGLHGVAVLDFGGDEELAGIAVGPNDTLYLAATSTAAGESNGLVVRLTRGGELDATFGDGGVAWLDTGGAADRLLSIQVSRRGVRVGGSTRVADAVAALAAELDHDGRLSPRYADDGIAVHVVGGASRAGAVALHGRRGCTTVVVARDTPSGGVEAVSVTFDARGRAERAGEPRVWHTELPPGAALSAGAAWWRGALYLAGAIYNDDATLSDGFLGRVAAGGIDAGFGGGLVTRHLQLDYAMYYDLSVTKGSMTVAGWEFSESSERLAASDALVARYRHDGSLDESFGDGGVVLLDFQRGRRVCGLPQVIE